MHRSPEPKTARLRDKYGEATLDDDQQSRRAWRESAPKARRFDPREGERREIRRERSNDRRG
jgi:hypothetical protein